MLPNLERNAILSGDPNEQVKGVKQVINEGEQAPDPIASSCLPQLAGHIPDTPVPLNTLKEAIRNRQTLPAKLPVHATVYNMCVSEYPAACDYLHPVTSLSGADSALAFFQTHATGFLTFLRIHCNGEAGLHSAIDLMTLGVWEPLASVADAVLVSSRDKSDSSSATVSMKRPDLSIHMGSALVLKGEEKEDMTELADAEHELLSKFSRKWSPVYFGGMPYILCFAVGGSLLQWCALTRDGQLIHLHDSPMRLDCWQGRVWALVASIHCFRAVLSMRKVLPVSVLRLHKKVEREHGVSLEAKEDRIVKKIKNFGKHYVKKLMLTTWEYVGKAYEIASKSGSVGLVEPLQLPSWRSEGDEYKVSLEPGYGATPTNSVQLLQAVTCVLQGLSHLHKEQLVHRDVRWPNVVHGHRPGSRSEWMLVDLETVWQAGKAPSSRLHRIADVLLNGRYELASDLRLVARLMEDTCVAGTGAAQVTLQRELSQAALGTSAEQVLGWQSFQNWKLEVQANEREPH
eukprot:CAMPEP_0202897964 /NCGR_PEP_ID=MMETSP1392-20130828/6586_1 /ASSEMBLY_ACC=CAM_ASM_000868 /TAXON_ID=225041 /ORGANISM="Chlamydomonas chlamydogama, Strain SAG 11-48b" /LENGTH=514 /DNA_ID=CAMNT_0049583743 /DNA_START=11 /DNA_END=1555 /DNA_ORIENTATION=-